ncbi:MAG: CDP-glucose 4,6-dehydratase [Bacteroidota bacterium]|nr:CDP-glucose 4,6-dehydratase [Bacteroidota bacterium]
MENMVNKKTLAEFFSDKKVFVTGHTGFKGSWLLSILKTFNSRVKGYALAPSHFTNLYSIVNNDDRLCKSVIHDIRDEKKLQEEIIDFAPDIIFHLAAQPLVRYSYAHPLETFKVNTIGTANVLNACRYLDKKCSVIIVTTDKVYENTDQDYAYKELDRIGGCDPYSASKAAAEIVTNSYRESYFNLKNIGVHNMAIATARAGNVIGGGDWSNDRIVADIVKALQKNQKIPIRNPNSIRPWQHVLDPLFGYLYLAQNLHNLPEKYSGGWNFGPLENDTYSVKELVEKAIGIWNSGSYEIISEDNAPHEAKLLKLNINKSLEVLNWKPLLPAATAIEWTIDWYKKSAETQKEFTFYQIQKYLEL